MTNWKKGFIFCCLCTAVIAVKAQSGDTIPGLKASILKIPVLTPKSHFVPVLYKSNFKINKKVPDFQSPSNVKQPFFCQLESKLEKKSGMPIRIRLGSVDYVDYLEGKGH